MWILCKLSDRWAADTQVVHLSAVQLFSIVPSPESNDGEEYTLYTLKARINGDDVCICRGNLQDCHKALKQILSSSGEAVKYLDIE